MQASEKMETIQTYHSSRVTNPPRRIPGTADYRGAALVEPIQHQYGIIDPIVILEGEITLLTEAEIRGI